MHILEMLFGAGILRYKGDDGNEYGQKIVHSAGNAAKPSDQQVR